MQGIRFVCRTYDRRGRKCRRHPPYGPARPLDAAAAQGAHGNSLRSGALRCGARSGALISASSSTGWSRELRFPRVVPQPPQIVDFLRAAQSGGMCGGERLVRTAPADWPARCPAATPESRVHANWWQARRARVDRRLGAPALDSACSQRCPARRPPRVHRQTWVACTAEGGHTLPQNAPSLSVHVSHRLGNSRHQVVLAKDPSYSKTQPGPLLRYAPIRSEHGVRHAVTRGQETPGLAVLPSASAC